MAYGDGARQTRQQKLKGIKAVVPIFYVEKELKGELESILGNAGVKAITVEEAQKYTEAEVAYLICDALQEQEQTLQSTSVYVPRLRIVKIVSLPNNPQLTGQLEVWGRQQIVVMNRDVDRTSERMYARLRNAYVGAAKELAEDWQVTHPK